ncbi:hypothetical protein IFR05_001646 [Cadophora sp. M221]|nr:hypothetical protein IFR05_001646 [Cadophora sp. M221]
MPDRPQDVNSPSVDSDLLCLVTKDSDSVFVYYSITTTAPKKPVFVVLAIACVNVLAVPLALPKPATDDTLEILSSASAAYVYSSYDHDKRAKETTNDTLETLLF